MHAFDFIREGGARPVLPVYVLVGDDPALRRLARAEVLRRALGSEPDEMAIRTFAGDHASLADVLDELRTLPFLSPRRIVAIENADPFVTAHRVELERYAEHPIASGVLVLEVKSWPATTRLAKIVAKVGAAIDCKPPRESELPEWLIRFAREREQVTLAPDAARLLVELVGPEVGLLESELGKVATFVGERRAIHREDVAQLVGAGRVETIWRILDAATTGRGALALDLLDRLLHSGEHPVALLAAISASLRKVHHAGALRAAKRDLREACAKAGIPPFAVEQTGRQHTHLGPARVAQLPERLLQADLDLKGGSGLDPRVVMERLLLDLASPRRD